MRNIVYACVFFLFAFTFSACGDQVGEGGNDLLGKDSSSKVDTSKSTGKTGKATNQDSTERDRKLNKEIMELYLSNIYDFFVCSVVRESLIHPIKVDSAKKVNFIKIANQCDSTLIIGVKIIDNDKLSEVSATRDLKNELTNFKSEFVAKFAVSDTLEREKLISDLKSYFQDTLPVKVKKPHYFDFKANRPDSKEYSFNRFIDQLDTSIKAGDNSLFRAVSNKIKDQAPPIPPSEDHKTDSNAENELKSGWLGILSGIAGGAFTGSILAGLFFNRRYKTKLKKEKEQFDFTIKDNERSFRNKLEGQERKYKELERVNAELAEAAETISSVHVKEQPTVSPLHNDQPLDPPKRSLYFGNPSQQGTFYHEAANSSPRPGQSIYELRLDESGTKGMLYVWDSPEAYTQAKGVVENTLDPVCERTQRPDISHTRIVTRRPAEMKLEGELWQLIGSKVLISFE